MIDGIRHMELEHSIDRTRLATLTSIVGPTKDVSRATLPHAAATGGADPSTVYVDFDNGDDTATGFTLILAVKTFKKALEVQLASGRTVIHITTTGASTDFTFTVPKNSTFVPVNNTTLEIVQCDLLFTATITFIFGSGAIGAVHWLGLTDLHGVELVDDDLGRNQLTGPHGYFLFIGGTSLACTLEWCRIRGGGYAVVAHEDMTSMTLSQTDIVVSILTAAQTSVGANAGAGSDAANSNGLDGSPDHRYTAPVWVQGVAGTDFLLQAGTSILRSNGSAAGQGAMVVCGQSFETTITTGPDRLQMDFDNVTVTRLAHMVRYNSVAVLLIDAAASSFDGCILDFSRDLLAKDPSLNYVPAVVGTTVTIDDSVLNATNLIADMVTFADGDIIRTNTTEQRAPRFIDAPGEDFHPMRAGVAFFTNKEGEVRFSLNSPAIARASGGGDAGALKTTYTDPDYIGSLLKFPRDWAPDPLGLPVARTNYQSWTAITSRFFNVWDSFLRSGEMTLSGNYWTGTEFTQRLAALFLDHDGLRWYPKGQHGIHAEGSVTWDFALQTVTIAANQLVRRQLEGWLVRVGGGKPALDALDDTSTITANTGDRGIWVDELGRVWRTVGTTGSDLVGVAIRELDDTWNVETVGFTGDAPGIWGSDRCNVWMISNRSTIPTTRDIHYFDGESWTLQTSSNDGILLNAIHGSDHHNVWAVGESGFVRHWNGSDWDTIDYPDADDLVTVFVEARTDPSVEPVVWVGSSDGTIRRRINGNWIDTSSPFTVVNTIHGAHGVVMAGGNIVADASVYQWDGTAWVLSAGPFLAQTLESLWVGSDVYALAATSISAAHAWNGTSWLVGVPFGGGDYTTRLWGNMCYGLTAGISNLDPLDLLLPVAPNDSGVLEISEHTDTLLTLTDAFGGDPFQSATQWRSLYICIVALPVEIDQDRHDELHENWAPGNEHGLTIPVAGPHGRADEVHFRTLTVRQTEEKIFP